MAAFPHPQLSHRYGPVFTIWLGRTPAVVLCGYRVVKDALLGHAEEFGGRPEIPLMAHLSNDYGGWLGLCTLRGSLGGQQAPVAAGWGGRDSAPCTSHFHFPP